MPVMPSGTVTFLFTDIQGSTRLWEDHPQAMQTALERHDALLRAAIHQHQGYVFKTIGDAFCAAFPTAPDALHAALDAQLALAAESWPDPVVIRVRMALHTGAAQLRDNDYFGQPLNRVARLLAVGHGAQVLLSDVAHDLCRDLLPPDCSLISLGEHRLRDLNRPEPLFQLCHPDLTHDFAPLKSLDNGQLPNNLPQQMTSFIGREKEMSQITHLLSGTRLLTLLGPGGTGKTRLSLQVAAEVLEAYPEGVWQVELAPLAEGSLLVGAVAQVLSVSEQAGQPLQQTLLDSLKSKRLLLVLDNCEHLVGACAKLASALLRSCPQVKLLATSREALGIGGEQVYRVPALGLPDLKQVSSPQSVSQYEAVRLFIERALLVKPSFEVTSQNAPALAQVCHRLDGIPLALELAAARVRSLSVEDLNARLDHRFRLLTGGDRSALPRQQTLRALIDWSYDLLSDPEKLMLSRLSVFVGGWTLPMAEGVCCGESEEGSSIEDWEVLDLLTALADKSLVVVEEPSGTARYRMLETVREYAGERLQASGESEALRSRHLAAFLGLAEEANRQLTGASQQEWLERLEREHDNLRAALAWCGEGMEGESGAGMGLRLSGALGNFWSTRGYWHEGREHLERALTAGNVDRRTKERALALHWTGALARQQGDYSSARACYEESLAIRQEIGDQKRVVDALEGLGMVAWSQGDYVSARAYYTQCLQIDEETGKPSSIASSLYNLGTVAWSEGDYAAAHSYFTRSLTIQKEIGNRAGMAASLGGLGAVAYTQGDYASAHTYFVESMTLYKEIGNRAEMALSLMNLGCVASDQGDYASAHTCFIESLAIQKEIGNRSGIAQALNNLGSITYKQGDYISARSYNAESLTIRRETGERLQIAYSLELFAALAVKEVRSELAAILWGAAEELREQIGAPLPPSEQETYNRAVAEGRQALGEKAFATAWANGRSLSLEKAMELALDTNGT